MTTLILHLLTAPQVHHDVRRDTYPVPLVESRNRLVTDLGDGCKVRLVAACSVNSKGEVACWDDKRKPLPDLAQLLATNIRENNRARFVPAGNGNRIVVYTAESPRRGSGKVGTLEVGAQFCGGVKYKGRFTGTRLIVGVGKAKELAVYADKVINANVTLPVKVGASAKIGRGTVRITEIVDDARGFKIRAETKGETYASLLFLPMDEHGLMKRDPEDTQWMYRNGIASGINTLGMQMGTIEIRRKYLRSLSLSAPFVRRYEIYGIPANP